MGYRHLPPLTIPTDPAVLGYLAALIDGEGHIGITSSFRKGASVNRSYSLRVVVVNTDPGLHQKLAATLSGGLIEGRAMYRGKAHWKKSYSWTANGQNAEDLIRAIQPYLWVKQEQAEVALALRDLGRGQLKGRKGRILDSELVAQREALKRRLNALNRRGIVDAEAMAADHVQEQIHQANVALDEMVERRMVNTGESEAEARAHVADYLRRRALGIETKQQ